MIYRTHRTFALALTGAVFLFAQAPMGAWQTYAALGAAYMVAPFPDLDKNGTWISQRIPVADRFLSLFGHRTLTHSLLFAAGVGVLLAFLHAPDWLLVGVILGWISHPLIDLLNPMGVHLLWPLPKKFWVRSPFGLFTTDTGSAGEEMIHWFLNVVFALLLAVMVLRYLVLDQTHVFAFFHLEGTASYWLNRLTGWSVQPWLEHLLRRVGVGTW